MSTEITNWEESKPDIWRGMDWQGLFLQIRTKIKSETRGGVARVG